MGDFLGCSVAGAGDVNNDNYADFIIGANGADPGGLFNAGKAYVYSGLDGVLLHEVSGEAEHDGFGITVAGAGDVNDDNYADFIIGAAYADPGGMGSAGKAYVYSGSDGSLLYEFSGEAVNNSFGGSVAGIGDVNNDYNADFIVGAGGSFFAGKAYVYSGLDGSLLYEVTGEAENDGFGGSVAGAGDVNNDNNADFIIGAGGADPGGKAYVYSGLNGSLLYEVSGEAEGDSFGCSVDGAGDVNNDGRDDFIIGAYAAGPGEVMGPGKAYVYSGLNGSLLYAVTGEASMDMFGLSVAGAGDLDNDGYADFLVNSSAKNKVYIYSGSDGSLLYDLDGEQSFGFSINGAGDVNNDGKDDIIVGANSVDPGEKAMAGEAYVYTLP